MSGFRFENTAALSLLMFVPVLFVICVLLTKRAKARMQKTLSGKMYDYLASSLSENKRLWKRILEAACLVFLIFAYARPQSSQGDEKIKNEGIEIVLMFDVSNSMLAEDVKPSRLELAKREMERFVMASGGDRMSIIAFAGSAVLLSPMTADKDALTMYIESLTPESVSTQGTVFRKALMEAREAFRRGGLGEQTDSHVTRAIVIVSDGEDHEPGAYDEAEKLVKEGIHIFTIAFGTENGAPIPVIDGHGNKQGYRRDRSGAVIMTQTKGTVLKELAKLGGGSFHHGTTQANVVEALRADISKLQKAEFESGTIRNYGENYQPLLFFAICIALIELFLGERKSPARIWRGRFEVGLQ